MKLIFNSYKTTELRGFIKEHNKKIRKEISEEIKEIRKKMKAKRLINVVGKKRDEIIQIMLKNKSSFKDIKMREGKSDEEKDKVLDEIMQPLLSKGIDAYKKNNDEKELRKVFIKLRAIAKKNDIVVDVSLKNSVNQIIKEIESEKPKIKKLTPLESQETTDALIDAFDLDTTPKKKKQKFKVMPKGTKPKVPTIKITDFDDEQLKKKVDRYLKKIEKKNGELYISLKDAKLVFRKTGYSNQYDRFKDLLKKVKTEKELDKLKKEAKKIVDKRFAKEKD